MHAAFFSSTKCSMLARQPCSCCGTDPQSVFSPHSRQNASTHLTPAPHSPSHGRPQLPTGHICNTCCLRGCAPPAAGCLPVCTHSCCCTHASTGSSLALAGSACVPLASAAGCSFTSPSASRKRSASSADMQPEQGVGQDTGSNTVQQVEPHAGMVDHKTTARACREDAGCGCTHPVAPPAPAPQHTRT